MIARRPTAPLYVAPVAHQDARGFSSSRTHGTDAQQMHGQQYQQYQQSSLNIEGVAGRRTGGTLAISQNDTVNEHRLLANHLASRRNSQPTRSEQVADSARYHLKSLEINLLMALLLLLQLVLPKIAQQ